MGGRQGRRGRAAPGFVGQDAAVSALRDGVQRSGVTKGFAGILLESSDYECYKMNMRFHQDIDKRGLELARHVVKHIDADPCLIGLDQARQTCIHWLGVLPEGQVVCVKEWLAILERSWPEVRRILLDASENGNRLRQNSPFCGILSNTERWNVLKECRANESRAA